MRRRVALVLVTIWLSGCATGASNGSRLATCPPVVEYSRELQAQAAEEMDLLPENSAVADMMADYAVMRAQARACRRNSSDCSMPFMLMN